MRFDLEALATVGDPVPMIPQVLTLGAAEFTVSSDGTLAYVPDRRDTQRSLVWVARDGTIDATPGTAATATCGCASRQTAHASRRRSATSSTRSGSGTSRATAPWTRLTFNPSGSFSPIWTRDGRYVIYGSPRDQMDIGNLYRRAANGGVEERLTTSDRQQRVNTITADGTRLIFEEQTAQRDYDFMMLNLANPTRVQTILQTPFDERDAEISPDGRWMAYDSNESGQLQVYVRPFPNVADAQYQISSDGGRSPVVVAEGRRAVLRQRHQHDARRGPDLPADRSERAARRGCSTPRTSSSTAGLLPAARYEPTMSRRMAFASWRSG